MEVLVVVGYCLRVNSSANLCHLSYIRGLIESGYNVDLISASDTGLNVDDSIDVPVVNNNYEYNVSFYEQLGARKRRVNTHSVNSSNTKANKKSLGIVTKIKTLLRKMYGPYGTDIIWYFNARKFRSKKKYDIVISLSSPPVSHKLVQFLLKKRHLNTKKWIQIWEDPWYSDIFGYSHIESVKREEEKLLDIAEEIIYVSPLTLMYQITQFPSNEHKMRWMPLPSYYETNLVKQNFDKIIFGYFGDYTSHVRNLTPFYNVVKREGIETRICGNSDLLFQSTESVHVHPRLPLNELKTYEDEANVLVFLCNLSGGQIPGKIYQYSATNKCILFILDGSEKEKEELKQYFSQFERFIFCENNEESILNAIRTLSNEGIDKSICKPLEVFQPSRIIKGIVERDINGQ